MRFLFYLPVVTPWWFDTIIAPMIRGAARGGEVHVLVPPLWQHTGIEGDQLLPFADLDAVQWHILDGADHPSLRRLHIDQSGIVDLVHAIAPDYSLCRSADLETPARFPGVVRHIMEGGGPPVRTGHSWVYLAETLFDHGIVPPLSARERARLDDAFEGVWSALRARHCAHDRDGFLARAGLPRDRRIIALPLEYEHPEMFFRQHDAYAGNIALIAELIGRLDEDHILAVTNHPLADCHLDISPLRSAIFAHRGRVHLVDHKPFGGEATTLLARHCDGIVVGNSKCFAAAAFFGTPMLRLSHFRSGEWMRPYDSIEALADAVRSGTARGADPDATRTWFAHHLLDRVFDAAAPGLDAGELADRIGVATDPSRWQPAIGRLRDHDMPLAA